VSGGGILTTLSLPARMAAARSSVLSRALMEPLGQANAYRGHAANQNLTG